MNVTIPSMHVILTKYVYVHAWLFDLVLGQYHVYFFVNVVAQLLLK